MKTSSETPHRSSSIPPLGPVWELLMGSEEKHHFCRCFCHNCFSSESRVKLFLLRRLFQNNFSSYFQCGICCVTFGYMKLGTGAETEPAIGFSAQQYRHVVPAQSSRVGDVLHVVLCSLLTELLLIHLNNKLLKPPR